MTIDTTAVLQNDTSTHEYLTFALDQEEYGIPILSVQEIIGFQKPTPIPNSPSWLSGMVNIRGTVIPVVCTRRLLNMPDKDYDSENVIIITQVGGRTVGSVVDQVNDVVSFSPEQIQPTPEISDRVRADSITGVGKIDDRLVMLLDIAQVLGSGADDISRLTCNPG
jgi:purine-binding chemotaxis protein CheW